MRIKQLNTELIGGLQTNIFSFPYIFDIEMNDTNEFPFNYTIPVPKDENNTTTPIPSNLNKLINQLQRVSHLEKIFQTGAS